MLIIQSIQNRIYEVRGERIMLDFDLAALYEVETKVFNQAVKRNLKRFPKDFMFQLTRQEWSNLKVFIRSYNTDIQINIIDRSQIVTSSRKHRGKSYLPYVFTEHGVTMLASVLRSDRAIQMNIAIVRVFIGLRKLSLEHKSLREQLERMRKELRNRLGSQDQKLDVVYRVIEKLVREKASQKKWEERTRIGFNK